MYEPCIISGKRGVKSLLNQPDVPAAASGIAEGGSHLRPQLGAGARGIWRDKSLLLRSDWQVPHGWRQSRHNAQVGSSVWWDQTPANWLFSGSSLQLGVSSVKICICLSMWFYKTKLITFTLELEGSQSLVGGGHPAEFAEAGLSICCQSLNNLEQNSHDCWKELKVLTGVYFYWVRSLLSGSDISRLSQFWDVSPPLLFGKMIRKYCKMFTGAWQNSLPITLPGIVLRCWIKEEVEEKPSERPHLHNPVDLLCTVSLEGEIVKFPHFSMSEIKSGN